MEIEKETISILNITLPIIGTLLGTILGGIMSYWASRKTLEKQFSHDSMERKLITKKEIYLQAIDNFSKANSYLGSITNNVKDVNLYNGFKDFFVSVSKISLISTKETIKTVIELSAQYQVLILKLTPKIVSLNMIKNNIDIQNNFCNKSKQELDRVLMLMREDRESLNINPKRFDNLNDTFTFEQDQLEKSNKKIAELNKQYFQEQIIFLKDLIKEVNKISPLTRSVFDNLRKELEIDTDIKYLNPIFEAQEKTINSELEKFIDYLSDLIEELDKNYSSKDDEDNK